MTTLGPGPTLAVLLAGAGLQAYLGEAVSLADHMLQAGALAEAAGASDCLVIAALLHDVGHLRAHAAADDRHAADGADWLAQWFPPSVTEPVRLHVEAKRYLCATDADYVHQLSPASVQSLAAQGGPMSADEAHAFEHRPHAWAAVAVRRWDEAAKVAGAPTPPFAHFRSLVERLAE